MREISAEAGVFFDFDGVLIDTENIYYRTFNDVLEEIGKGPLREEQYASVIGHSIDYTWDYISNLYNIGDIVNDCRFLYTKKLVTRLEQELILRDDAEIILHNLRELDIPSVLVTSSTQQWTNMKLKLVGLDDYFRAVVTADDVIDPKPAPDMYKLAAVKGNLSRDLSIAIEDSYPGVESSKRAGIYTIGLKNSLAPNMILDNADQVVERLTEIDFAEAVKNLPLAGMITI
tara:strand:- start:52 stop:744 length:693 start_codon:yes stop_codon:yes gene_type:complete